VPGDRFLQRKRESELDAIKRFEYYYTTRRLALYLYLYFTSQRMPKEKIKESIANILMPSGKERTEVAIKGFFSQILGVSIFDFPFGATIEDLTWFEYDLKIPVLDDYRKFRQKMNCSEDEIAKFLSKITDISSSLTKGGEEDVKIIFNELKQPYLFDRTDLKLCLSMIDELKNQFSEKNFEDYFELLEQVDEIWVSKK